MNYILVTPEYATNDLSGEYWVYENNQRVLGKDKWLTSAQATRAIEIKNTINFLLDELENIFEESTDCG